MAYWQIVANKLRSLFDRVSDRLVCLRASHGVTFEEGYIRGFEAGFYECERLHRIAFNERAMRSNLEQIIDSHRGGVKH